VEPHNEANGKETDREENTVSKSKTSMLLAIAAVAVGAFGSASVAQAGLGAPQKHPDGVIWEGSLVPQKHPDIIGVLKRPDIIGVLKHPDIIGVLKHPDGRLQKHPEMIQKFSGGNASAD
jgi:hypothetical protein